MRRPVLTKLIECIPHTVALRSGIYIGLRGKTDAKHFWGTFTSPEYMSFVPDLAKLQAGRLNVIDCGAGIGMFSLLIEHLRRLRVLPWTNVTHYLIEPSDYNLPKLKRNIARTFETDRYRILEGLVGARRGESTFYQSRWRRWGSSVYRRRAFMERTSSKSYVDLGELLREGPCVLKVDIEGAEFQMLDVYRDELDSVEALIMEWHAECGDVDEGGSLLESRGLIRAHRHEPGPDRLVDLYVRRSAAD